MDTVSIIEKETKMALNVAIKLDLPRAGVEVEYDQAMGEPIKSVRIANAHRIIWANGAELLVLGGFVCVAKFPPGEDGYFRVTSKEDGDTVGQGNGSTVSFKDPPHLATYNS